MSVVVDFISYAGPVRANAYSAPVLAERLVKAAPLDLSGKQLSALELVRACAKEVQAVRSDRDRRGIAKTKLVRAQHLNAWIALHGALHAVTRVEGTPQADRATALLASLFPTGVAFAQLKAASAWAEGRRHLDRIDDEDLAREIDELVQPQFLVAVRDKHARLADAVGVGASARVVPSTTALNHALARFGAAVGGYARQLMADVDESDDASCERFLVAMAPIDEHRASARGPGEADESDEAGESDPADEAGEADDAIDRTTDAQAPIVPPASTDPAVTEPADSGEPTARASEPPFDDGLGSPFLPDSER
jgi:hypothetical protein